MKRRHFLQKTFIASAIMPLPIIKEQNDRPNKVVL
jgi:hypothetical protein